MIWERRNIHNAPLRIESSPPVRASASALSAGLSSLIVKGQGVIEMKRGELSGSLRLSVSTAESSEPANVIHLEVGHEGVSISDERGEIEPVICNAAKAGLDPDPDCVYWFSIDSQNRRLRYGKGEVRKETELAEVVIPGPVGQRLKPCLWVFEMSRISCENARIIGISRDPMVAPLPLFVIPSDAITMDQVAQYQGIVPAHLAPEAQGLYWSICGQQFELNTADFPHFTDSIEASIKDPGGWCYQTLAAKADEFGTPDPMATYLRITLGVNQGESPGIPYVLEIWPPGHRSPIHNHAGAHAVIRVLHGEITVNLYPMLSVSHQDYYWTQKFAKDTVTWISPRLNQTHKLYNANVDGPTCMTIQCYAYGAIDDSSHYEYFDYIDNSGQEIKNFDPNSDMDFVAFKALMQQEWRQRNG